MPTDETGRKKAKYKKPRPISKSYDRLFTVVLDSYLTSIYLIAVGNIPSSLAALDPTAKRPLSLIQRAEHVCDVERAVRSVLKTKQEEDCFDQLLKEIADHPLDPSFSLGLRANVVSRVGRVFERCQLSPRLYFVRSKR
jgi:hypothetical protein